MTSAKDMDLGGIASSVDNKMPRYGWISLRSLVRRCKCGCLPKKHDANCKGRVRYGSPRGKKYRGACAMDGVKIRWVNGIPMNMDGSLHMLSCNYVSKRRKRELSIGTR